MRADTKDLWFLPNGGPGRQYRLEYAPVAVENAATAIQVKMFRKFAAGEVATEPIHRFVLAVSTLTFGQLGRTFGATGEAVDGFLRNTAERAAACLDVRLPPPIEEPIPDGFVVWLSVGDFGSERTLTYTLVKALG